MNYEADTADCPDRAEFAARAAYERSYWRQLAAHPHPWDPDHPGPMYEREDE